MTYRWIIFLLLTVFAFGRQDSEGFERLDAFDPPRLATRDRLYVEDLFRSTIDEMVHNQYFLPLGNSSSVSPRFSSTLSFEATPMETNIPNSTWEGEGFTWFPSFSISMISHGDVLIPLQRGLILCGERHESVWNIIVEPGRIWREIEDDGYARASFPFTLTTNGVGQARNGVATFVFDEIESSNVYIQSSQETTPSDDYIPGDLFAMVPVEIENTSFENADEIIASYENEMATRLPVFSWSALDNSEFLKNTFTLGLTETDQSAGAVVLDGTIYLQPCATRTGPYPFPGGMRHGVFSVTKTLCGSLAMFFLAEKYGEDVFEALICDYVQALSDHPGWQGVTFAHTLNMVTGTRGSEDGMNIYPFIVARDAEQKIDAIAVLRDAPPAPGEGFNYASTNFFVLSYAMNQYVKQIEGESANYWDMVIEEVLRPIGAQMLPVSRTVERDGSAGIPILGWGSYPTVDEAAKIAMLFHREGEFQGQQLLNGNKIRQALNRHPWPGYVDFYRHSFWLDEEVTMGCVLRVPHMSGHGGNMIGICPSGLLFIRFADANRYEIAPMVRACESIRSSCRP